MEVVEVLAVDEEVEHVVPLLAHLQPRLHPVQLRRLEELRRPEGSEEVLFLQALGRAVVQLIQHVALKQLLVAHAHLDGVVGGTVLVEPGVEQRHVEAAAGAAGANVEGAGGEQQRDTCRSVVRVQGGLRDERLHPFREHEILLLIVRNLGDLRPAVGLVERDRVDERVVVKRRQVRILRLDVHHHRVVVHRERHLARPVVVQVRERHLVLGAEWRTDDELVDVVELVPVLIGLVHVAVQRLELGAARDAHVQRLRREEGLALEQVEVVLVRQIAEQLPSEAEERGHDWQREPPFAVALPVYELGPLEGLVVVKPVEHRGVLILIELQLDGLQRIDV
mmetsp:Transcript_26833/g.45004  ORF Transcript_26833/g.45004 Transcript_26833/m.45004 type:complete len:337 (+) Transcript_26833:5589-6599(+)